MFINQEPYTHIDFAENSLDGFNALLQDEQNNALVMKALVLAGGEASNKMIFQKLIGFLEGKTFKLPSGNTVGNCTRRLVDAKILKKSKSKFYFNKAVIKEMANAQ